ncbi:MAG: leucine-rich repeat domain-containing protein [Eubacterium sp.]
MKKIISLFITFLITVTVIMLPIISVYAKDANSDFKYAVLSETDRTCKITNYTGSASKLTIPSSIDGYTVIAIDKDDDLDSGPFENNNTLNSVSIPNSVIIIGEDSFESCNNLEYIELPYGITSIGSDAFNETKIYNDSNNWDNGVLYIGNYLIEASLYDCDEMDYCIEDGTLCIANFAFNHCKLKSVRIPSSLYSLGDSVPFHNFTENGIENIYVDSNNSYFCDVNGVLFDKNKTKLIKYPDGKTETSYSIPDSVTRIEDNAFENSKITDISIPENVSSIGRSVFYNSELYKNEKNWENEALYIDDWLTECNTNYSGQLVVKPNTIGIAEYGLAGCKELSEITLPTGIKYICDLAFYNCEKLETINIPKSVTQIGVEAFGNCKKLREIDFDSSKSDWYKLYIHPNEYDSFTVNCTDENSRIDNSTRLEKESEDEVQPVKGKNSNILIVAITIIVVITVIILSIVLLIIIKNKKKLMQ